MDDDDGRSFTLKGSLRQVIVGEKEFKSSQRYLLNPEVRVMQDAARVFVDNGRLVQQETEYYIQQLSNMNGPLNYYRTVKARFEEEKGTVLGRFLDCFELTKRRSWQYPKETTA